MIKFIDVCRSKLQNDVKGNIFGLFSSGIRETDELKSEIL